MPISGGGSDLRSAGVSFFEVPAPDPESDEPEHKPPAWSGPPDGVLPAFSTQRVELARTDSVVLVVDRFLVYPNGLVFTLLLMRRQDHDDHGHVPWEMLHRHKGTDLPDDFVRFGILFEDGTKWTNLTDRYPHREDEIDGPVVMGRGGGGGGKLWEMSYWMWPLPAPGKLTFVVAWPAESIAEQQVELEADELRQLAAHAEQIWADS